MVSEGALDNMTKMVLVNAIYFKGTWNDPFNKFETYEDQFRLNKVKIKNYSLSQLF